MGFSVSGIQFDGHFCRPITLRSDEIMMLISETKEKQKKERHSRDGNGEQGRLYVQFMITLLRLDWTEESMESCGRSSRDSSNNHNNNNNNKVREPWCRGQVRKGDTVCSDLIGGFSWPPRSYICSYCKREFRSAQALGGHMNVHRRDRARLRQSLPWDPPLSNHNPNPNPTATLVPNVPNLNVSPPSKTSDIKLSPGTNRFPSLLSPLTCFSSSSTSISLGHELFSSRGGDFKGVEAVKAFLGVEELRDLMKEGTADAFRKEGEVVRLDLEIGTSGDSEEDDLDLELRLGYT